jgi:uncharacterized protein YndB with AHSA1/START domain
MTKKERFDLEFVLKTSPKVLEKMLVTTDGLSEWFADDVSVADDVYTFHWDGSDEQAKLLSLKNGEGIKWRWIRENEVEDETYFEMRYAIDPMTNMVILTVVDFADSSEEEEFKRLWNNSVQDLRRYIGA